MMLWTEDAIKNQLDGWFFSMGGEFAKISAERVPVDHIPDHTPPCVGLEGSLAKSRLGRAWTEEEDDSLLAMFLEGRLFREMGKEFGVSEKTARNRFIRVCSLRGIKPKAPYRCLWSKFPMEMEDQVIRLHADGLSFRQIGEKLGITVAQAGGLWTRRKRRQEKLQREAA